MGKDSRHIRAEIAATRERMGETFDAIGYKADVPSRLRDSVRERVDSVRSRATNALGTVTSSLTGTAHATSSRLKGSSDLVSDQLGSVQRGATDAARAVPQNPLGLALSAFALGLLAGFVIPVSDIEREKLQPLQDSLAEKTETLRDSVVEHGKAVVQETVATATASGQAHAQAVASEMQSTPTAAPAAAPVS